ncbi:MAG: NAD(P)-dependent oxidoreductase [Oceanospirillaceae bacterium]|nr:NAD(P)-dependent oxidoreductase [Oceanospirillaceae bacterium]
MPSAIVQRLAFIGFGEAASAVARGLTEAGVRVDMRAYDIKSASDDAAVREQLRHDCEAAGVQSCATLEEALAGAELVFSLVTADQAAAAARSAASLLAPGQHFLDCNSCSPGCKAASAAAIATSGAFYSDVAVMAPIYPARQRTPLLIAGEQAPTLQSLLERLGMNATLMPGAVGAASTVKMLRSIMIKGMEALSAECFLAARSAGIEEQILQSLDKSFPGFGWREKAGYNLERMRRHGIRRAAEMREVTTTLAELGIGNEMASATTVWQQRIGDLQIRDDSTDLAHQADSILQRLTGATD